MDVLLWGRRQQTIPHQRGQDCTIQINNWVAAHISNKDLSIHAWQDIITTHRGSSSTSVIVFATNSVNKLQEGPPLVLPQMNSISFWDYIAKWGGTWMWEGINATQRTKEHTTWIAEGMQKGTLIWTIDGTYNRKKAVDLSGVGWIIFCKWTGLRLTGLFWERSPTTSSFWVEKVWPVHPPSFGTCNHRIPPGVRMDSHNIVW